MKPVLGRAFLAACLVLAGILFLGKDAPPHPLSIDALLAGRYPGGAIEIVREVAGTPAFRRYIISYPSDGLRIGGLMEIPRADRPARGFPVVILARGYVPREEYSTGSSYRETADFFAGRGYLVAKTDYRGYGGSEGAPADNGNPQLFAHDILNLAASVTRHPDADPGRMVIWGHSMGANAALRALLASPHFRSAVLVSPGVISPTMAAELLSKNPPEAHRGMIKEFEAMIREFGPPDRNRAHWDSISLFANLALVRVPVGIHFAAQDPVTPPDAARELQRELVRLGKVAEAYEHPGTGHLSPANPRVLEQSAMFFERHLRGIISRTDELLQ